MNCWPLRLVNKIDARMKLALIRAKYHPFGGAERFLNDAVAALAHCDLEIAPTLFTREWPAQLETTLAHRIINPRYATSSGRDRGFAQAVCSALSADSFDLVQSYERLTCCDIYHAVDGVHAEWLRQRHRISSPIRSFGVAVNPRHRYILAAERAMFTSPRFKAAICISEMVKNDILRHFKIDPAKLHVIYSGVDTIKFSPALRADFFDTTRNKLAIPLDVPVALFVGSGFERKGLASFLRALAATKNHYGIVVGKDKNSARYQAMAQKLGLQNRVRFTGGVADTRPHYAASDVFVLPTLYEPFGLVCLEAMACGVPVITSTSAGAAELIQAGVNGYVCDALDVAAIHQAMEQATAVENHLALRLAARDTALRFSLQMMSDQYIALYRLLLKT